LAVISVVALVGIVFASGALRARLALIGNDIYRMEQSGDYNSSTGQRILMWKGGWVAFLQAPLAGYGYGGRMEAVRQALPEQQRRFAGFTHPHNAYLAALLDAGILGLVVLLALLAVPVWVPARARHDGVWRLRLAAGMILTLCYAVSGAVGIMFEHDLMNAAFVVILIVLVDSAVFSGQQDEHEPGGYEFA
jgi:O-antigen ligase